MGHNSIILPRVTVPQGCILVIGTIVTKDTESYGIYGGIPVSRIGEYT